MEPNQDTPHPSQAQQPVYPQHPQVQYVDQTPEHLRLLSVFHLVMAILTAIFALFPIFHFGFGIFMAVDGLAADPSTRVFGGILAGFAGCMILIGWVCAYLIFLAGKKIERREGYTFCLVIAGLLCVFAPLGTALGVFTFVVLLRPQAQVLFGRQVEMVPVQSQ